MTQRQPLRTNKYKPIEQQNQVRLRHFFHMKQALCANAEAYVNRMIKFSSDSSVDDATVRTVTISGLNQEIEPHVKLNLPQNVEDIVSLVVLSALVRPAKTKTEVRLLQVTESPDKKMLEEQEKTMTEKQERAKRRRSEAREIKKKATKRPKAAKFQRTEHVGFTED